MPEDTAIALSINLPRYARDINQTTKCGQTDGFSALATYIVDI